MRIVYKFLKSILATVLLLCTCAGYLNAQSDFYIGTGTATNSNNGGFPCPLQDFYEGSRAQYLFRASEFTAAGMGAGTINAIKFRVMDLTGFSGTIEQLTIRIGGTSATTLNIATWETVPATAVYGPVDYVPVLGFNTLTFGSSFNWNGTDNIVIEICNGDPNNANTGVVTNTLNPAITWTTGLAFNGSHTRGLNNSGNLCGNATVTNAGTATNRPNIVFNFTESTPCNSAPTPGVAVTSSAIVCNGEVFTLSLSGHSKGSGQTYLWQSSPDNSAWTDMPELTNPMVFTSQVGTKYYRAKLTCSGNSDFSASVQVTTPALAAGVFTINKNFPTSGSNFQSFNDAVNAIKCGISGPVVFNVEPSTGPYNEQIVIPQIYGASAVNTITFNGNGNTMEFTANTSETRAVIYLNGADHIIIDSLNINASAGTFGWGVFLTNAADSNTIRKCTINVGVTGITANFIPITVNGSITGSNVAANNGNYNLVENNTLIGGIYGVMFYGQSPGHCKGNISRKNTITDFYSYANYLYGQESPVVSENDITRPTRVAATSPIVSACYSNTSYGMLVEKNRVHNLFGSAPTGAGQSYVFYQTGSDGTSLLPNKIINNLVYDIIGNATVVGFYNSSSDFTQYYHNTLVLDDPSATNAETHGFYQQTFATGVDFRNNIIYITRGGTGLKRAMTLGTTTSEITSNNNVFYFNPPAGSTNFFGQFGSSTTFATFNLWKGANSGAYDQASLHVDPAFINFTPGDYKPSEPTINNIGAALGIATDIYGVTRTPLPDPGAVEFALDACIDPPTPGTATASTVIACANEDFSLNLAGNSTGAGQTYQWQVSPDNATWVNIGSPLSSPLLTTSLTSSSYYQCLVTCGAGAAVPSTSVYLFKPTVVGNYTINNNELTGGANFASFTEAAAFLKCGVTGPVVFTVEPFSGPYYERVVINAVPGTSSTNTVTFKGNGAIINFTAPDSDNRTAFLLNGADHIILDSLSINVSNGATYGWGIQLTNQADSNIIRKCSVISSTSSTSTNYMGIVMSGSTVNPSTAGVNGNDNQFLNNTITGGYSGVFLYGHTTTVNTGNVVRDNILLDQYDDAVYLFGQKNAVISGNDYSRPTRTNYGSYGFYVANGGEGLLLEKNRVHNTHDAAPDFNVSFYGIYVINNSNGLVAAPNRIENNLMYNINNNAANTFGIYVNSGDYWNIYHNTVILDNASSGSNGTTYGIFSNDIGSNIKNNIVYVTRGGPGTKACLYLGVAWTGESDNNVLHTNAGAGTNYAAFKTIGHTLAEWKASNSNLYDQLSSGDNPLFLQPEPGDWVPSQPTINNLGANLGIATDIKGMARTATPDPGAFEFSVAPCTDPPTPGTVNTVSSICANMPFVLEVAGSSIGEGIKFQWQSSPDNAGWVPLGGPQGSSPLGTTQAANTYYRALVGCGAGTPIPTPGVLVTSPLLVPASTFTINNTLATGGGNFQSFADALSYIACGISGPLVFNVTQNTGPYIEQVVIPQIPGASATNTITFNGNGNTLSYNIAVDNNRSILTLAGADHIIIDSLMIDASQGTYGYGIMFTNQADSNIIRRCTITTNTTETSFNYAGIVFSGAPNSLTVGANNGNGNLVENNIITGGYHGVSVYGATNDYNKNNKVKGNTITDYYYTGVYTLGTENTIISGNDISRPTRTSSSSSVFGISIASVNGGIVVEKNKIHNIQDMVTTPQQTYGLFISGDGLPGNICRMENNIVYNIKTGNSVQYGISAINRSYWTISHNTINLDDAAAASGTTYGIYGYGANGLNLYNNNVSITRAGTGVKYCLYMSSSPGFTASNNNNLYINSPASTAAAVGYYPSATFITLDNWKTANGSKYDQESYSVNPLFVDAANGNLAPQADALFAGGNALAAVADDILGVSRSLSTPTVGAFEVSGSLPVTMLAVHGKRVGANVQLGWSTLTELNNKGFEVERSTDGRQFVQVGFVDTKAADGNHAGKLNYEFTDVKAPVTEIYYRLKQLDKDGKSTTGNVVLISKQLTAGMDITGLYPNPVSAGDVNLQMTSTENMRVTMVITDITGRVLSRQATTIVPGTNQVKLSVKSMPGGTYFVKAVCESGCESMVRKFVIR